MSFRLRFSALSAVTALSALLAMSALSLVRKCEVHLTEMCHGFYIFGRKRAAKSEALRLLPESLSGV